MSPPTVHLLVNPASRRGATDADEVEQQLRAEGHRVERLDPSGADDVADAIRRASPDRVVAVGGDGLLHRALPALVHTEIGLGIVPSGTGNDFARALALPKRRSAATTRATGPVTAVDVLRATFGNGTSVYAASAVTAGFSGRVTATANARSFPKGQLKYTVASLIELRQLQPFELAVDSIDGVPAEGHQASGPCAFFAVANTRYFGGGMAIAPNADATDGRLHATVVSAVPAWQLALVLPTVFVGQHVRHPRVHEFAAASTRLEHDQEVWADGEPIGTGPVSIDVVPKALFVGAF